MKYGWIHFFFSLSNYSWILSNMSTSQLHVSSLKKIIKSFL